MCSSSYFVKKKSRLDFVIFLCPIKVFVDLHPKNDLYISPTMIFFNKVQMSTHCNLHIFFQFHYYSNSFFLLVSSYVLKLYPHVIGMDK